MQKKTITGAEKTFFLEKVLKNHLFLSNTKKNPDHFSNRNSKNKGWELLFWKMSPLIFRRIFFPQFSPLIYMRVRNIREINETLKGCKGWDGINLGQNLHWMEGFQKWKKTANPLGKWRFFNAKTLGWRKGWNEMNRLGKNENPHEK